jgi:hypothetical protein
MNNPAAADAMI